MKIVKHMIEYSEETGGIYSSGNIEAIPYNHWRKDYEWLVMILDPPEHAAFIPVEALTAREACTQAIYKYSYIKDLYE